MYFCQIIMHYSNQSLITISKRMKKLLLLFIAIAFSVVAVNAQHRTRGADRGSVKLSGTIFEYEGTDSVPLAFAVVTLPDYELQTMTSMDGSFALNGVPVGKTTIKVSFVGKLTVEKTVDLSKNTTIDIGLQTADFHIKEVTVTAQASQAGQATASMIGRTAMDHLQATNLSDVMSLLPGGLSQEPNLSGAKTATIRSITGSSTNSLGTAVIRDGAPISNNANLSSMNPTIAGSTSTNAGGAPPTGGVDLRSISTDNIESVEVIRGIPSVEHGDLTSGAVIINSKAGREPLRITGRANPKVYMGAISTGLMLGKNRGALNFNADYAHNTNDPIESYRTFERVTARTMYSKELFSGLRSNTSLNFNYIV